MTRDTKNGNGKWQLAFWVVTVLCGSYIFYFSHAVSGIEKARAEEDRRIEHIMAVEDSKLEEKLLETKDCINEKLTIIMADIREIKTRMGIQ